MTVLINGKRSFYLGAPAAVATAEDVTWASKHVIKNDALLWMVGNYVQADQANQNGHYWTYSDLVMSQPSVSNIPVNMGHHQHSIVGHVVASEFIHPDDQNPYIQTAGVVYRYYFPDEAQKIEAAFADGTLWSSMECVAKSISCLTEDCDQTFPYVGATSPTYCEHVNSGQPHQFNDPHFLASAVVLPPSRPGWNKADVLAVGDLIRSQTEEADRVYESVSEATPHLSPDDWEMAMAGLMVQANADRFTLDDLVRLGSYRNLIQ